MTTCPVCKYEIKHKKIADHGLSGDCDFNKFEATHVPDGWVMIAQHSHIAPPGSTYFDISESTVSDESNALAFIKLLQDNNLPHRKINLSRDEPMYTVRIIAAWAPAWIKNGILIYNQKGGYGGLSLAEFLVRMNNEQSK